MTLAVGEHVRMPRTYRGRDILWWMDASGLLDERWDAIPDLVRARALPSMQLVGAPPRRSTSTRCAGSGWRLVGRLAGVRDGPAQFSGSLRERDARWPTSSWAGCWTPSTPGPTERASTRSRRSGSRRPRYRTRLRCRSGSVPAEIETIVWATGFRPDLSFLDAGVFDRKGRVVHDGGVTAAPGLYLMGLPFLRRRRSTLIDGAAADARDLAEHLVGYLAHRSPVRRAS